MCFFCHMMDKSLSMWLLRNQVSIMMLNITLWTSFDHQSCLCWSAFVTNKAIVHGCGNELFLPIFEEVISIFNKWLALQLGLHHLGLPLYDHKLIRLDRFISCLHEICCSQVQAQFFYNQAPKPYENITKPLQHMYCTNFTLQLHIKDEKEVTIIALCQCKNCVLFIPMNFTLI